jgi:gamma-glutamyltranspeptidase/glutathione hydrolase
VSTKSSSSFFSNPLEKDRPRADYFADSTDGMVASAHPEASKVGKHILLQNGNAVDAAVATSFMISVLRPQSTGIGGGGFLLLGLPHKNNNNNKILAYDFRERAPQKASQNMYLDKNNKIKTKKYKNHIIKNPSIDGHLAVGTPGLIAGLLQVHHDHGSLSLASLIEPAIKIAREGFVVYPELAQACEDRKDILSKFEDSKRIFMPNGSCIKAGDLLIQKDLAWTLEQIAHFGHDGFYNGPVSAKITAEIAEGQGVLSQDDLTKYKVKIRTPLESNYRGYKIYAMPPPSSGGVHIIEMLNILSNFDLKSLKPNSSRELHILAETMKRAFSDRASYLGDPDFVRVPLDKLLSPEHGHSWAKDISLKRATPARELGPHENFISYESPSTTHISVVDKNNMAVSTTQTINYSFGSGVVARGTGIVLNDEMDDFSIKPGTPNVYGLVGNKANAIAAYKTMLSSMSPTLVFDAHNNLKLVVGSPGGPRIINATLQTIINILDHTMTLTDAVHSFRIHNQWLPDITYIEPGSFDKEIIKDLENLGHNLQEMQHIGDVQAIEVVKLNNKNIYIGVSDTRSNGKPF